ncbi:corticotropin-releasing factor receptor 1-like [Physella acuta]|uniref:corticotropin-releasing factor receptor 1-like n=1 Tax=Physella acuta TaxID=109671 RepID=UPI0027DBD4B1|nr:corticotropin-releasing factor receptor 1-like [Physella acuta]
MIYCYLYGGSINLVILTSALAILICCKQLRSYRNTIHINLLASFFLRFTTEVTVVSALKAGLEFQNVFYKIVRYIFNYIWLATFMWMLVEGLYLHFILVLRPFQDSKPPFLLFYFIGWGFPILIIISWSVCVHIDSKTHPSNGCDYVITVTTIISLMISLIIVINLIRIIFMKLSSNNNTEAKKIWQVSKSLTILMFLLGPIHLVFAYPINNDPTTTFNRVYKIYNIAAPHVQAIICAIYSVASGKVIQTFTRRWSRFKDLRTIKSLSSRKRSSNATISTQFNISQARDDSTFVPLEQLEQLGAIIEVTEQGETNSFL